MKCQHPSRTMRRWRRRCLDERDRSRPLKHKFDALGLRIPFDARFRTELPPDVSSGPVDQLSPTETVNEESDSRKAAVMYTGEDAGDQE